MKLSSLQKLTDIRANKPGMNLIHYVALVSTANKHSVEYYQIVRGNNVVIFLQQAEKNRKDLLKFPEEMSVLEEATK